MSKIAVVTGAASGIGEEAAHDLVAHDWAVYGLDVTQDGLDKTAAALKNDRFHPVLCDIRSAEAVQSAMAEIGNRTGKINALIASAGVNRLGALSEMSVEDFNLVFDVNVRGLWLSARETIPFLRAAAKDYVGGLVLARELRAKGSRAWRRYCVTNNDTGEFEFFPEVRGGQSDARVVYVTRARVRARARALAAVRCGLAL